jgi:Protein of unknown function (DUF3466)
LHVFISAVNLDTWRTNRVDHALEAAQEGNRRAMRLPERSAKSPILAITAALLCVLSAPLCHASFLPVYGGPAYDPTAGGYLNPVLPMLPGMALNATGTVVGYAAKTNAAGTALGNRALRWNSSGTISELGLLGTDANGLTNSYPYAINSAGVVTGAAEKFTGNNDLGSRAVRWSATSSTATELGNLGADATGVAQDYGVAINTAGTVAGYADKYSGGNFLGQRATRWSATTTSATELGNLGTDPNGVANSEALAINTSGTIVGYAEKYTSGTLMGQRAVRWSSTTITATELGNLGTSSAGLAYDQALAINDAGTIVGTADKYVAGQFRGTHAVMWGATGITATELGGLGTDLTGVSESRADAVNATGTIVGFANKYASGNIRGKRAVRWNAGSTTATELGNLGTDSNGVTQSEAYSINGVNAAFGYANMFNSQGLSVGQRAVLWRADGVAINLNSLIDPNSGWTLDTATAVNDAGWISGIGMYDPDGPGGQATYSRMFLIQSPLAEWLLGDFDHNRVVNAQDISAMLSALTNLPGYESSGNLANADLLAIGDLNGDGKVTNADLQGLINLIKGAGGSGAQAVPEPSAIVLAAFAAGTFVCARRCRAAPLGRAGG